MADPFTPKFVDLVKNVTTTTGTGDFTLGAAVNGFKSFTSACQVGDRFYYSCLGMDKPAEREVGRGTLLAGGKIAREPIGGAAPTNFTTGNKAIALIAAAEWFDGVAGSVAGATSAAEAANTAAASATSALAGIQSDVGALEIQVASLDSELDGTVQDLAALEATVAGMSGGGSNSVASRSALAGLSAQAGEVRELAEAGREGTFKYSAANLASFVSADPLQGVYVAPASDPSGASGAWVRQGERLTPFMFGAQTNYRTGDRVDMIPPYGESQTEGSVDGVLADSRAQCQAMLDLIFALRQHKLWKADFSGGLWGISKRDDGGPFADDGLVIEMRGEYPTEFIGGGFRAIGSGRNLINARNAGNCIFSGYWHLHGANDSGSGVGYANRTWENGLWVRNCGMSTWDSVRCTSFRRWGVEFDPEFDPDLEDYNNNIGLQMRRVYVGGCGSGRPEHGNEFAIGWTASSRTGSAVSYGQRTNLTLASGHEILRVGDIVKDPAGDYHVIMEKAGAVISIYPWMISTAATGTLASCHGGGVKIEGKDVAGLQIQNVTGIGCGVSVDFTNILHGVHIGETINEGSRIGLLVGTVNGINLGHVIDHVHSEGVDRDILAINSQHCGFQIGAASAWAGQDYRDCFKLCESLSPNDGAAKASDIGLPQVSLFLNGVHYQSGATLDGDATVTKSRAYAPTLSNGADANRIRKVETGATNVTLKYFESHDRCLRDSFVASLEVSGAGGVGPNNPITVTLDAADVAAGIQFANGTTASTYVVPGGAANGPVLLDFWLDTSGSTLRWIVVPRTGLSDPVDSIVGITGTLAEFNAAITDANIPQASADLSDGSSLYKADGTDVALADGGTGASLSNPGADRLLFWDDSIGQVTWLSLGSNLNITGTELDSAGGGGGLSDGDRGDVVVSGSGATWTVEGAAGNFAVAGNFAMSTGCTMRQDGSYFMLKSAAGLVGFESNSTQIASFSEAGNWLRTYLQILNPESDPYGAGWNGSGKIPTKDEIYDKLEGALTPASVAATGAVSGTSLSATGAITTSGGKFGYATGNGGTVTQSPNKSSGVTLNKACGEITMSNAALAANTAVTFTLTNSTIEVGDRIVVNHKSGGTFGAYVCDARAAAGSASVMLRNLTAGSLSEAVVLGFAVMKAVTA